MEKDTKLAITKQHGRHLWGLRVGDDSKQWKHARGTPKPAQSSLWKREHLSCELKDKSKLVSKEQKDKYARQKEVLKS